MKGVGFIVYTVQDEGSGCLLSERSFWTDDGENWMLYGYTGKLGTSFSSTLEGIQKVLSGLQERNKESRLNRKLHIIEVDEGGLPIGETVKIS